MKIKYVGTSHFRQLLVEDLKQWEVKIDEMLRFAQNEVTEVEDDVAKALLNNLPDEFVTHTDDSPPTTSTKVATGKGAQAVNSAEDPSAASSSS